MNQTQKKFSMGQVITPALIVVTLVSSGLATTGSWFVTRVLSAPETQAAAVGEVAAKVDLLCNDYINTVSRMDQNLQNIAKAVKATVVSGAPNSNPCKSK